MEPRAEPNGSPENDKMEKIQRKRRAIANPKIHFGKIDGRDTRTSNFLAYTEVRENCEFRSSTSRYFIKWIFLEGAEQRLILEHLRCLRFHDGTQNNLPRTNYDAGLIGLLRVRISENK